MYVPVNNRVVIVVLEARSGFVASGAPAPRSWLHGAFDDPQSLAFPTPATPILARSLPANRRRPTPPLSPVRSLFYPPLVSTASSSLLARTVNQGHRPYNQVGTMHYPCCPASRIILQQYIRLSLRPCLYQLFCVYTVLLSSGSNGFTHCGPRSHGDIPYR